MEHNLAKYAKYYSCGCIEILGSGEFTRETNHNRRDFLGHWSTYVKNKLYFELRRIA
jgi:hypothetical protein